MLRKKLRFAAKARTAGIASRACARLNPLIRAIGSCKLTGMPRLTRIGLKHGNALLIVIELAAGWLDHCDRPTGLSGPHANARMPVNAKSLIFY